MLVVGIAESAERSLGLARVTVPQDDQPPVPDLLGHRAVALDDGIGQRLQQALISSSTCSASLAARVTPTAAAAPSAPAAVQTSA